MRIEIGKYLKKYILTLLTAFVVGTILLFLVFLLPVEPMRRNMGEIADSLIAEGRYPQLLEGVKSTQLDNFTDRIMIMAAIYDGEESAFKKAVAAYNDDMDDLKLLIEGGTPEVKADDYAHYWHGYLVFLKPFLMIMNYYEIRLLNEFLIIATIVLTAAGYAKKGNSEMIIPYALAMSVIHPMVLSMSMQYSTAFYVMSWLMLYLIYFWDGKDLHRVFYSFFIAGIGLCYMDLFTYPLIVYGIPAVYALQKLYRTDDGNQTIYVWFKRLVGMGISAGAGYSLMFGLKWILAFLVVGPETMTVMKQHLLMRFSSGTEERDISRVGAVVRNLAALGDSPYVEMFFAGIVLTGLLVLMRNSKRRVDPWKIIAIALIMISPAIWWVIFANHSYLHYFFTYRSLAVEVFALFTVLLGNTVSIKSVDVV